jgi:hypothetical protein
MRFFDVPINITFEEKYDVIPKRRSSTAFDRWLYVFSHYDFWSGRGGATLVVKSVGDGRFPKNRRIDSRRAYPAGAQRCTSVCGRPYKKMAGNRWQER